MRVIIKKLENGIKNVIINDPKTYNSLSFKTINELIKVFKKLDKDKTTKVIILEGAGKGFSFVHSEDCPDDEKTTQDVYSHPSLHYKNVDKSKIIESVHIAESYLQNSVIKKIDFEHIKKNGKQSTQLVLEIEENINERKAIEIKNCILKSSEKIGLSESARNFVVNTIDTLILAEASVHGESEESVHFHEAASIDTVIDILGTAVALDDLDPVSYTHLTLPTKRIV